MNKKVIIGLGVVVVAVVVAVVMMSGGQGTTPTTPTVRPDAGVTRNDTLPPREDIPGRRSPGTSSGAAPARVDAPDEDDGAAAEGGEIAQQPERKTREPRRGRRGGDRGREAGDDSGDEQSEEDASPTPSRRPIRLR